MVFLISRCVLAVIYVVVVGWHSAVDSLHRRDRCRFSCVNARARILSLLKTNLGRNSSLRLTQGLALLSLLYLYGLKWCSYMKDGFRVKPTVFRFFFGKTRGLTVLLVQSTILSVVVNVIDRCYPCFFWQSAFKRLP